MPGGRPRSQPKAGTDSTAVKSVAKVLDILEHLSTSKGAVSVSDLARATGFNVSTAFRLLQTLTARGYVDQQSGDRSYILGPRIFQLGSAYLEGNDLAGLVRPHLESLRDAVGETVYLTILRQGENIQLCKADGQNVVSATVRASEREPAFCTANGKVLLSGLPVDELTKYVAGIQFHAYTANTITSRAKLMREIELVKARGYALDMEEFAKDLCCIGVPVRRPADGSIAAAISVAMPRLRFRRAQLPSCVALLQDKAQQISQQLAFVAL